MDTSKEPDSAGVSNTLVARPAKAVTAVLGGRPGAWQQIPEGREARDVTKVLIGSGPLGLKDVSGLWSTSSDT